MESAKQPSVTEIMAKSMTQKDKVCRNCRLFVEGSVCPICKQSQFSRSWKGIVVIRDPNESEIAKVMGITVPGKYAIWVK